MPLIEVRGVELHYTDTGSGPVALFVHGFPLDGMIWSDQVERLSGEGRRCVVPDLAGFGRSAPVVTASLGMERHADDLAALLDALGATGSTWWGCPWAVTSPSPSPSATPGGCGRWRWSTPRRPPTLPEGKAGRDASVARLLEGGRAAFAAEMATVLLGPDAGPMLHARVRQMIESTRYETIVAALVGLRDRGDRTAVLAGSTVPVAVVVGEHDGVTPPAAAEAMVALHKEATLDVVPGAGHLTPIEAPDAVAGVLQGVFDRGPDAQARACSQAAPTLSTRSSGAPRTVWPRENASTWQAAPAFLDGTEHPVPPPLVGHQVGLGVDEGLHHGQVVLVAEHVAEPWKRPARAPNSSSQPVARPPPGGAGT